jgi:STE24 endopeptidase
MGSVVLVLSPAFIRLAWPTRPLPPGPLRDRLERVADRFGFRCTDILVWDTGGALINAGVTGALPWFRYVLLTDALIEDLDPHQVAAVFGHEIGHIAHRHLLYFGFFSLGSLGVMALAGGAIDASLGLWLGFLAGWGGSSAIAIAQAVAFVICLGLYFLLVFGHVSRRFERQADVFGCRAVSCGRASCPPHLDWDDVDGARQEPGPLCPVGIRIFAAALANVAMLNGMERRKRSWRHGSIQRRIEFLEGLVGEPESERLFQVGVSRLRVVLALVLIVSVALAVASGSIEHLR